MFALLGTALPALADESAPWPGPLRVALVSPTGNAPIGKPSSVQLNLTRPSKEVTTISVHASTIDADLVPATPVKTGNDGEYVIDVSNLPVGVTSMIPFTMTLHGGEGGGARVLVADNLGGVGEDLLHFGATSADYGGPAGVSGAAVGLAYAVPAAGQVLASTGPTQPGMTPRCAPPPNRCTMPGTRIGRH